MTAAPSNASLGQTTGFHLSSIPLSEVPLPPICVCLPTSAPANHVRWWARLRVKSVLTSGGRGEGSTFTRPHSNRPVGVKNQS